MDIKAVITRIQEWLHLKRKAPLAALVDPPSASVLFSTEQMERYGASLARSHRLSQVNAPDQLLVRLSKSEETLVNSYRILTTNTTENELFSPAREWLLDNFYLIQEQINMIRRNLPKGYGRTLPQLADTPPGYPRVYDIAAQIIGHGDGRWDLENLRRFIMAYQEVTPLTLGELWAIPITLGVALIENLSTASKRIVAARDARILADYWADRMIKAAVSDPKKIVIVVADMARSALKMNSAFIAELTRRLQGAALALPLTWIEQHLADEGLTIEQLVQEENKHQAANQVSVSNSIASLRRLAEVDWRDFVEATSVVEATLSTDPSGIYRQMDFGTRDRYRHVVERLARMCLQSEQAVASAAILLAKQAVTQPDATRGSPSSHVGFYLIGNGLPTLHASLGVHYSFWQRCGRLFRQYPLFTYVGAILLVTFGLTIAFLLNANQPAIHPGLLLLLGTLLAICTSQLAVALVNFVATVLVKPEPLPRMDFSRGIPSSAQTLVVVPALLTTEAQIERLVEGLEVRFLGNRDPHLYFALLTDFNDAPKEHMPNDAMLLALVKEKILALNANYGNQAQDVFFLFHRARQWNAGEQIWMGKERKRGKLADLNKLLRRQDRSGFSLIEGRSDILAKVKYVITLDTDTQLPRESARQFVATMMHPLNLPVLDAEKRIVVSGYGILQPRVAEALPLSGISRYVRLSGNEFGMNPYTRTVSDVYQDLFQQGSFVGKGIYDVDLFLHVLENRFPDNRILSHDLLEGCYLRSGFLSDVPLYENSPNSYLADAKRRMRWIRGDWQLFAWLCPYVPNASGHRVKNPLSLLSKYKLLDNLRRSLVPIAIMAVLILNWAILFGSSFWLLSLLLIVLTPVLVKILHDLFNKPPDVFARQHITNVWVFGKRQLEQLILYVACLPYEAWYSLSAIVLSNWRMLVSKRHLLAWTPSDQVEEKLRSTRLAWLAAMWPGPSIALIVLCLLTIPGELHALLLALPLLMLWLSSPFLARWVSQPPKAAVPRLDAAQLRFLHQVARKTWHFFETFVTAEDHWLPPDNYQEAPVAVLARRTSPTNIGLTLLANLSAYDFGYITCAQLLERTQHTLQTMTQLERYRGHFYNWYSTQTLTPLLPRYVSTVDSGNLAAHLLTLRQGLLMLADAPILSSRLLAGLEDTWALFAMSQHDSHRQFENTLSAARAAFTNWSQALNAANALCLAAQACKLADMGNQQVEMAEKLVAQCHALHDEISRFAVFPDLTMDISLRTIALWQRKPQESLAQREAIIEANRRIALIETLAAQAFAFAQMDFSFLYDQANHLMTIGFNVDEQWRDPSNYDLLSSEARLGAFVAIAQGQVQQESWFALGRQCVVSGGEPILVSWSGSMFEYLMPLLVMPSYPATLLDQTYETAVKRQIAYGKARGVPWGISESCFNAVDNQSNYLYRAFGVPGLGLKRGLEEDLVIAPYASAMALMVAPEAACLNLQRLAAEHALGQYGFYEAIDYTPARLSRERKKAIVRSFMVHHQAMSFLAISYVLHGQPMQHRFVADSLFQTALLLLQERLPKPISSYLQIPKPATINPVLNRPVASMRVFNTPNTRTPQVQMLSNGRYHVVLTQAGSGYSRFKALALTRWREDTSCDHWGSFSYVCDVSTGEFWSTSYQPTLGEIENYKAIYTEGHAEFTRSDHLLDQHMEVVVSPEDDIELRRIRIHNRADFHRTIELTSYSEIVLAPQASDVAQPAFSNLFVETEILPQKHAILAKRRSTDPQQSSPWLFHLLNIYAADASALSFETDRARFIGRTCNLAAPIAMLTPGPLSNSSGAVLDPVMAIRSRVSLAPDALVTFDLLTGVAETRALAIELVEKYQDRRLTNRVFGLAWTHGQVLLHQLNISEANAQLYGRLASSIIYANNKRRADPRTLSNNRRGQSSLWGYGISGDLPIILLQIEDASNIELVRQLIQAQAYWRHKGLIVDLLILNGERMSYRQSLQEQIMNMMNVASATEHAGVIVVRPAEQVPAEDLLLFQAVARVILSDKSGTLREQLAQRRLMPPLMPLLSTRKLPDAKATSFLPALPHDLLFFNGLGGFTKTGKEYVIRLSAGAATPAPWINILTNPYFGTLVSECGQSYTWIENAQQFRLTPWENDPVADSAEEAFYLRDEETGLVWSPTPLPVRGKGDYQIRHGFGYSIFEHVQSGIHSELCMYVAIDEPVKFVVLKVMNTADTDRTLSATAYVGWVLGDIRAKQALQVTTQLSTDGAILAQNHYNSDFGERTAFLNATTTSHNLLARSATADRMEFLGRNGSYRRPAALKRSRLSGRMGAGYDPCGAIQIVFDLAAGQSREIVFTLGVGANQREAEKLIARHQVVTAAHAAFDAVKEFWDTTLGMIHVHTPDPAVNLLANGWLLYQVLSSRLWGRTGYYQSAGAFGFRDQLQDVMALSHVAPERFRAHLLLCAAHQFEAGDVQHWWHPPTNRGVRTRCSDDYLWLPFAICHYIETTGDRTILDETAPFLQGRPLNADEESYYDLPSVGTEALSLYEHAVRAIHYGLKFGEHGLPLMGAGDWNDGMNLVGQAGRGESIWLGFFLYSVLKHFAPVASERGDGNLAALCEAESARLQQQLEAHGWDGAWYRRAYFDDGTPLGSTSNTECRIDSVAQSWSVLSKAANSERAHQAMLALDRYLVDREGRLVKLLDPPFDHSHPSPGYIEGYVPGIRENGGQYTHAAIWAAMAFAEIGEKERAWEIFNLINPIHHGSDPENVQRYKIENYVIAGDVYSVAPHIGRGGWSWYTGSAAWFYRLIIETLLGIRLEGGKRLHVAPKLPNGWDGLEIDYRFGETLYKISLRNGAEGIIDLQDDGMTHEVIF